MTSIAVVGMGYDGMLDKLVGPFYSDMRWYPEDDYYLRLTQAARGERLVHDVLSKLWVIYPANVHIALEEPFPLGMIAHSLRTGKSWDGSWIKQQCEVAGAFKGALGRHGYTNLYEINNSQWHATLRKDGVEFINTRGMPTKEKRIAQMANKFKVKTWGMQAFGLPDFPDLVKSKSGAKIPRPESGYGARPDRCSRMTSTTRQLVAPGWQTSLKLLGSQRSNSPQVCYTGRMNTPSAPIICACNCGCEPDGDWHFNEPRCVCVNIGCDCVTDEPGKSTKEVTHE